MLQLSTSIWYLMMIHSNGNLNSLDQQEKKYAKLNACQNINILQSNQLQSHINGKWLANKIFRLSKRDCNDDIFYLYWTQLHGKDWMSNLLYFAKWHIFCSAKIIRRIKKYDFCFHFWNRSEISARYFVFSIWTCNII